MEHDGIQWYDKRILKQKDTLFSNDAKAIEELLSSTQLAERADGAVRSLADKRLLKNCRSVLDVALEKIQTNSESQNGVSTSKTKNQFESVAKLLIQQGDKILLLHKHTQGCQATSAIVEIVKKKKDTLFKLYLEVLRRVTADEEFDCFLRQDDPEEPDQSPQTHLCLVIIGQIQPDDDVSSPCMRMLRTVLPYGRGGSPLEVAVRLHHGFEGHPDEQEPLRKIILDILKNRNPDSIEKLANGKKPSTYHFFWIVLNEPSLQDLQDKFDSAASVVAPTFWRKAFTVPLSDVFNGEEIRLKFRFADKDVLGTGVLPLHQCVKTANVALLEELIQLVADRKNEKCKDDEIDYEIDLLHVNCPDSHGNTPLHVAITERNEIALEVLLKTPDINVLTMNDRHETVLHLCAKDRRIPETTLGMILIRIREEAIKHQEQLQQQQQLAYNKVDGTGTTAAPLTSNSLDEIILQMSFYGDETVHPRKHLPQKFNPSSLPCLSKETQHASSSGYHQPTPLHVAAQHDNETMMFSLMQLYEMASTDSWTLKMPFVNLNAQRSRDGKTALHLCVETGNLTLVKLLLKHGADVRARDGEGNTVLHDIAQQIVNKPALVPSYLNIFESIKQHVASERRKSDKKTLHPIVELLEFHYNNEGYNVMQYAHRVGSAALIHHVFTLDGIYRHYNKTQEICEFDVTNLTPETAVEWVKNPSFVNVIVCEADPATTTQPEDESVKSCYASNPSDQKSVVDNTAIKLNSVAIKVAEQQQATTGRDKTCLEIIVQYAESVERKDDRDFAKKLFTASPMIDLTSRNYWLVYKVFYIIALIFHVTFMLCLC